MIRDSSTIVSPLLCNVVVVQLTLNVAIHFDCHYFGVLAFFVCLLYCCTYKSVRLYNPWWLFGIKSDFIQNGKTLVQCCGCAVDIILLCS